MENAEIRASLAAVDDRHFAIVEKDQVMVYDNSKFYPTPMPTNSRRMSMRVMLAITTLIPCRVSSREMNNDVRGLWLLI